MRNRSRERKAHAPTTHGMRSGGAAPAQLLARGPAKMSSNGTHKTGSTEELSQWMLDAGKRGSQPVASKHREDDCSYMSGKDGHIDLEHDLEAIEPDLHSEASEELDEPTQIDVHTEIFPEERRFEHPKTPASRVRPARSNGASTDPLTTTPRLPANPLANNTATGSRVLGASQLFGLTQAPSSPLPNALPSDAPSRPSPNIPLAAAYRLGNPPFAQITPEKAIPIPTSTGRPSEPSRPIDSSSPFMTVQQPEQRAEQESNARPSPLQKEQQLTGRPQIEAKGTAVKRPRDESPDDGMDLTQEERLRMRARRRKEELKRELDSVRVPARPASSAAARTRKVPKQSGPAAATVSAPARPKSSFVIIPSDDDDDGSTEDETEQTDGNAMRSGHSEHLAEDNKENVDVRKGYRRSVTATSPPPAPVGGVVKRARPQQPFRRSSRAMASTRSSPDELAQPSVSLPFGPDSETPSSANAAGNLIAVADSQASATRAAQPTAVGQHAPAVNSSESSRKLIPQSQARKTPNTSQLDSSMARRLLASSSQQTASPPPSSPGLDAPGSSPHEAIALETGDRAEAKVSNEKRHSMTARTVAASQEAVSVLPTVRGGEGSRLSSVTSPPDSPGNIEQATSQSVPLASSQVANESVDETPAVRRRLVRSVPETTVARRFRNSLPPENRSSGDAASANAEGVHARSFEQPTSRGQNSTAFQTAPTHQTRSRVAPQMISPAKSSLDTSPGQGPLRPPRPLTDIAMGPSPPDVLGEIDLDLALITNADVEFRAKMAQIEEGASPMGPARKRRRGLAGRAIAVERFSSAPRSIEAKGWRAASSGSVLPRSSTQQPGRQTSTAPASKQLSERKSPFDCRADDASERPLQLSKRSRPNASQQDAEENRQQESKVAVTNELDPPYEDDGVAGHEAVPSAGVPDAVGIGNAQPTRILAQFNVQSGYYPATCLGLAAGPVARYRVCFDDGTVAHVATDHAKKFDLRPGDNVKVDAHGHRAYNFVVQSIHDGPNPHPASQAAAATMADARGRNRVTLLRKQKPARGHRPAPLTVPLANIYLTSAQFFALKDREYVHDSPAISSGMATPSERPSTPSSAPTSRARLARHHQKPSVAMAGPDLHAAGGRAGLLSGIVFVLTAVAEPQHLADLIEQHGGTLLRGDLTDLFDVPAWEGRSCASTPLSSAPPSSAGSHPRRSSSASAVSGPHAHAAPDGGALQLREPFASDARFAVLLSDRHCRTSKYFQAIALGLPCVSAMWVRDCVRARALRDWRPYLLASGESSHLGGAICSRTLPFAPTGSGSGSGSGSGRGRELLVPLAQMVSARAQWLQRHKVLLVGDSGMMQAYVFLAYALGASHVALARSRALAQQMLDLLSTSARREWDWVVLHEERKAGPHGAEVGPVAGAGAGGGGGRKRKRAGPEAGEAPDAKRGLRVSEGVRVVDTEFVMQSLIMGSLLEDP